MSTSGAIARKTETGWEGRYHDCDGYPIGLGKALWDLYHGHFNGDLDAMLGLLIDDHPAGWFSIIHADLSLSPAYPYQRNSPMCFCHAKYPEESMELITPDGNMRVDFVYIFDTQAKNLQIAEMFYKGGYLYGSSFDLDGPEPDWSDVRTLLAYEGEPRAESESDSANEIDMIRAFLVKEGYNVSNFSVLECVKSLVEQVK